VSPKAYVLNSCFSAHGATGKWKNLKEMGSCGERSSGHWEFSFNGNIMTPDAFSSSLLLLALK
jgi:hypothetical protein